MFGVAGCDKLFPKKDQIPEITAPEEQKPKAFLDVDKTATEQFRKEITARFPNPTPSANIEAYFKTVGFECSQDPTSASDRACTKIEDKDNCMIMSIIRTEPFTPDGAQIIKGCKVE